MPVKSPQDLLVEELREIHSGERQLARALQKLGKAVSSDKLGVILEGRRERGAQLTEAIDDALEDIGATKGRKKNVAIEGLLEDLDQHMEDVRDPAMRQVAMVASLQKIEHYCIAAWGTAASLGRLFQTPKVVEAMERALEEGKRYDAELTELAETEINPAMLGEAEEPEESGEEEEGKEESEEAGEGGERGSRSGRKAGSRKQQSGGGRKSAA